MFIKKVENFLCEHCGEEIIGNGYTNHCPKCLYSKHVDIEPGDRKSDCWGLMEPYEIDVDGQEYSIIHKCLLCGYTKKNKVSDNDNFDNDAGSSCWKLIEVIVENKQK